jgi:hypothetical protein
MTSEDRDHLQLLSIFHYVVGGLAAMFALIPVIHLTLGLAMISGVFDHGQKDAPPEIVGWFFVVIASFFILFGLTFATLIAVAGRFLSRQKHHLYCLVMAGVECIFAPFGTVLGVFTLIVLMRPSVKAAFGAAPPAPETA